MLEEFVKQFGEEHRAWIEDALKFLDENEARWKLPAPINRRHYIAHLYRSNKRREGT